MSGFQRGAGVYTCISCNRRTRGTPDSASLEMCGQCDDLASWDNHHNDHGTTPDAQEMVTFNALLATIVERGGDAERVKGLNDYLWTE